MLQLDGVKETTGITIRFQSPEGAFMCCNAEYVNHGNYGYAFQSPEGAFLCCNSPS